MDVYKADYEADKKVEKGGFNSTRGIGRTQPAKEVKFQGSLIPKVLKSTKECVLEDVELDQESELQYNEYVVYNLDQVHIKFICHIKFNFNDENALW